MSYHQKIFRRDAGFSSPAKPGIPLDKFGLAQGWSRIRQSPYSCYSKNSLKWLEMCLTVDHEFFLTNDLHRFTNFKAPSKIAGILGRSQRRTQNVRSGTRVPNAGVFLVVLWIPEASESFFCSLQKGSTLAHGVSQEVFKQSRSKTCRL